MANCYHPPRSFVILGRGKIRLIEELVFNSLGVPRGELDVDYRVDPDVQRRLMAAMFPHDDHVKAISASRLGKILMDMTENGDNFKRLALMFVMCTILAPTRSTKVSNRCYPTLDRIADVANMNWCKFVADQLHDALSKKQFNKGCHLHLMGWTGMTPLDSIDNANQFQRFTRGAPTRSHTVRGRFANATQSDDEDEVDDEDDPSDGNNNGGDDDTSDSDGPDKEPLAAGARGARGDARRQDVNAGGIGPQNMEEDTGTRMDGNAASNVDGTRGTGATNEEPSEANDAADSIENLGKLANEVKPKGTLGSNLCEVVLDYLRKYHTPSWKILMPYIVGAKLASGDHNHRVVQEAFRRDDDFKLSQKDIIMFPTLEDVSTIEKQHIGHWHTISLDLKYQRFEVLDSMRTKDDPDLCAHSGDMICHIK
ncbi:hypothetical protein BRADI_5g14167v3 [Brachypodium distachyon]|uniref:Ubiquitin-like protease family profile domain-containing protein n=1 Tax=Brachypodium distachyon TaxID=15368 RepID=A0A2K2CH40_BRADI|nr:hypothetical protein BRADI_5g14167v3 [Brachypodium distachyon]